MTTTYIQLTPEQLQQVATDAVAKANRTNEAKGRADLLGKVELYTAEQAAQMIGVTAETVRKYAREGRLPKRGRFYHIDDVEMFILDREGKKQQA